MRWKELPLPAKIITYGLMLVLAFMTIAPFLYFLSLSLSNYADTYTIFLLPKSLNFDNYVRAWNEVNLGVHYRNSIYVTASALALNLIVGSMAAYALARFRFRCASRSTTCSSPG